MINTANSSIEINYESIDSIVSFQTSDFSCPKCKRIWVNPQNISIRFKGMKSFLFIGSYCPRCRLLRINPSSPVNHMPQSVEDLIWTKLVNNDSYTTQTRTTRNDGIIGKNQKHETELQHKNKTHNTTNHKSVSNLKVVLKNDVAFIEDISSFDNVMWSLSSKPRETHMYSKKKGIHAIKAKRNQVLLMAYKDRKIVKTSSFSFPTQIAEKYSCPKVRVFYVGYSGVLTIKVGRKSFHDFAAAKIYINGSVDNQDREKCLAILSIEEDKWKHKKRRLNKRSIPRKDTSTGKVLVNDPLEEKQREIYGN